MWPASHPSPVQKLSIVYDLFWMDSRPCAPFRLLFTISTGRSVRSSLNSCDAFFRLSLYIRSDREISISSWDFDSPISFSQACSLSSIVLEKHLFRTDNLHPTEQTQRVSGLQLRSEQHLTRPDLGWDFTLCIVRHNHHYITKNFPFLLQKSFPI